LFPLERGELGVFALIRLKARECHAAPSRAPGSIESKEGAAEVSHSVDRKPNGLHTSTEQARDEHEVAERLRRSTPADECCCY